jgi:choline dehydrogenase-like flavoprotein
MRALVLEPSGLRVGADNFAVEVVPPVDPEIFQPCDQHLIMENRFHLHEGMTFEGLVERQAWVFAPVPIVDAQRSSASNACVKPVESRKNLTVRLNARTLKVEVQNGRAIDITVAVGTGRETLNADREVIVSCGAIGSPRLLQP